MNLTPLDGLPEGLRAEITALGLDIAALHRHVTDAISEDLPVHVNGGVDVTSAATIDSAARGEGDFGAREDGVVAGLVVAELVFAMVDRAVVVRDRVPEGTRVRAGDRVMSVSGPTRSLLTGERVALNFASHLSGIASATARWVEALEGTGCRVLDTRKTLPGWRQLQKYAVRAGGGVNHRFSLADKAMVKDNHVIAAGGVVPAFEAVRAAYPQVPVEVEVTSLDELREVLSAGCTEVLLDNMDTATLADAVRINREAGSPASLEASGGLTLDRAREVGATGVDFVSTGALTHSVTVFDLGLDLTSSEPGS